MLVLSDENNDKKSVRQRIVAGRIVEDFVFLCTE